MEKYNSVLMLNGKILSLTMSVALCGVGFPIISWYSSVMLIRGRNPWEDKTVTIA